MRRHHHNAYTSFLRETRDAARTHRQAELAALRLLREQQRAARETAREQARREAQATKEAKERYLLSRQEEVDDLNDAVEQKLEVLGGILDEALDDNEFSFEDLRNNDGFPPFVPPRHLAEDPNSPPALDVFVNSIRRPNWFIKLFGGQRRYERNLQIAERQFKTALDQYTEQSKIRKQRLAECEREYDANKQAFEAKKRAHNDGVDALAAAYLRGEEEAVVAYNTAAIQRISFPAEFPRSFRVAYSSSSKELIVEMELPSATILPKDLSFRYVKARDAIEAKARKEIEIRSLYTDLVASTALRTALAVFQARENDQVILLTFNGYLETTDPATGRDIKPYLISVRITQGSAN
jgi:restriction system protein